MEYYFLGKAVGLAIIVTLLVAGFKRAALWKAAVGVAAVGVAFMALGTGPLNGLVIMIFYIVWYGLGRIARWGWDKLSDA